MTDLIPELLATSMRLLFFRCIPNIATGIFLTLHEHTAVATPSWHRPRAEPQELHRESPKTKKAQSYKRLYLLPRAWVLAAAALNLLGPGGGCRRPSSCPLLLLLAKASLFLLPWKTSESSAVATSTSISMHKEGTSTSNSTQCPSLCRLRLPGKSVHLWGLLLGSVWGETQPAPKCSWWLLTLQRHPRCSRMHSMPFATASKGAQPRAVRSAFPVFSFPTLLSFATFAVLQPNNPALQVLFLNLIFPWRETDFSLNLLKPSLSHSLLHLQQEYFYEAVSL